MKALFYAGLVLSLTSACASPDDEVLLHKPDGGLVQKDRVEAIAWCMAICFEKHTTMCPAMDTLAERQDCYDACQVMVLPAACEDEYVDLAMCRLSYLPEYVCSGGAAVPANNYCDDEAFTLTWCRILHG